MNTIRRLMSKLFGWKWCVLIDHDGTPNVRKVHFIGLGAYAWRFGLGVRRVRLHGDGKVTGASYVRSWEPVVWGREEPPK